METPSITILVFDGLTALDAVGPYEVLSKIQEVKVNFVSPEGGKITCQGGLQLVSDYSINDITETNVLIIPGGPGIEKLQNNELLEWIKRVHEKTTFTCSVCTGALLLGEAGLLKNKKATTHWNHLDKLISYEAEPLKSRFVIDEKIITSAGVSAGIDMSLKLVELLKNASAAQIIQLAIEYDPKPPYDAGSPDKISAELLEIFKTISSRKS